MKLAYILAFFLLSSAAAEEPQQNPVGNSETQIAGDPNDPNLGRELTGLFSAFATIDGELIPFTDEALPFSNDWDLRRELKARKSIEAPSTSGSSQTNE